MKQNIYRSIFWTGYAMVFVAAFIPFKKDLHEITFNIVSFKFHFDQVLHTFVYLLICLYFLAGQYLGMTLFKDNSFKKYLILILVLATITEAIQFVVPSRVFNFIDWVANMIGIIIGLLVMWLVRRKLVMKKQGVRSRE